MELKDISATRTFIIVEPDPVVGLDLAGALSSAFPNSAMNLCMMAAEAKAHISDATTSFCILLNSRLASDEVIGSLRTCVSRGAQVVFVGTIDNVDFPADVVEMPFTTKMIMDVLG